MKSENLKTTNCTEKSGILQEDYSNKENILSFINSKNPEFFEYFDLLEYLNGGNAGCVYRGIFKGKLKKQVAIKFFIKKENNQKNENHEIKLSKKFHFKYITETFGYYQSPNINYSILEYGKFGDIEYFLRNLLKRLFLSETALNYFSFQILESLQYIHKCKISHMDIKPGNILINSNLDIKITDFSVACSYSMFQPNEIVRFPCVGTGRFMSPEILSKAPIKIKDCDKIDIYSLGVTLYYLFYDDFPYKLSDIRGKDYEDILKNIKNEELVFPEKRKISFMFKDFLVKLLEKDCIKRVNITQALNHPWIQGVKIIFDEKENTSCQENFMIRLITDNIPNFNEYINLKIKNQM